MITIQEAYSVHELLGYYVFKGDKLAVNRIFKTELQARMWIRTNGYSKGMC